MGERVFRRISEPIRESLSWTELWKGCDNGLIHCWELGRKRAQSEPHLAEAAMKGELPSIGWKGGLESEVKYKARYGCLQYLAEWQGLRGDNLDIDQSAEATVECTRTGVSVTFTPDSSKWSLPGR